MCFVYKMAAFIISRKFYADHKVRKMVTELEDRILMPRMASGDLIAIEAKNHTSCLVNLYNRYRSHLRNMHTAVGVDEKMNESRAFVELLEHIDNCSQAGTHTLKLSELHALYTERLSSLGISKSVNKTRLKEKILEHFPECTAQFDGRNIVLIFHQYLRILLRDAVKDRDYSDNALFLAKAAKIIRKDIFAHQQFKFNGTFRSGCQSESVPSSLLSLVSLILIGANIERRSQESQAYLTISQLMDFNAKKISSLTAKSRHKPDREPPLPIYIGLNVHSRTRSKALISEFNQLGLSIPYRRVLEIEDWLVTAVSERFDGDGVVCPAHLRRELFTTGALDNLDHNPSSNTSQTSFHGTSISLFQNVDESHPGEMREPIRIPPLSNQKRHIPDHYAIVPPVSFNTKSVNPTPSCILTSDEDPKYLDRARKQEQQWLHHASSILDLY